MNWLFPCTCAPACPQSVRPSLSPARVPQPGPCVCPSLTPACAPAWPLRAPQPARAAVTGHRPSGVSHSTDFSQFRGLRSPRPRRWPAGFPARATFPAGGPCALTGPFLFALEERDGVISLFLKARSFRLMMSSHPNRREGASSDPRPPHGGSGHPVGDGHCVRTWLSSPGWRDYGELFPSAHPNIVSRAVTLRCFQNHSVRTEAPRSHAGLERQ